MAAIYMWREVYNLILTTTLYPVEVSDSLSISASVISGEMDIQPLDKFAMSHDVIEGAYTQKRWYFTDGPYEDSFAMTHDIIDSSYVQKRWYFEDGPYNDSFSMSHDVVSAAYLPKLIYADSPDEKLIFSATILDTCTMELIV